MALSDEFKSGDNDNQLAGLLKVAPMAVVALLVVVLLTTSWYRVDPEERAVVLRFGKYSKTVDPGLHFKLPFRIDTVYKVPVRRQIKMEFGFRTERAAQRTSFSNQEFDDESLMLTGDLNVADVEWVTQFKIKPDPREYLFNVRNVEQTLAAMNEAVVREVVGDRTINEVLTYGRQEIQDEAQVNLQELCDRYGMGINIDKVILQDVNPPEPVKPAFNEVNQAQQQKETLINQAQQEYNRVIPKARGDAERALEEARGYAIERVNRARGEAERFNDLFEAYKGAPDVTRRRMYLESVGEVFGTVGKKIVIDQDTKGILPMLNLNKEGAQ